MWLFWLYWLKLPSYGPGVELHMEVDTGASASIISQTTYHKLSPTHALPLQPSNVKLHTYTREELKVLGSLMTEVQYLNQKAKLHLLVVAGSGPSLLGQDWIANIHLDWQNLQQLYAQYGKTVCGLFLTTMPTCSTRNLGSSSKQPRST